MQIHDCYRSRRHRIPTRLFFFHGATKTAFCSFSTSDISPDEKVAASVKVTPFTEQETEILNKKIAFMNEVKVKLSVGTIIKREVLKRSFQTLPLSAIDTAFIE
jgi:hypothetical protein